MDSRVEIFSPPAGKVNILCFTAFYLPGNKSGGPVRSISALASKLKANFIFNIFTSDRDINDSESYKDIELRNWSLIKENRIYYSSNSLNSYIDLVDVLNENTFEILYLNSFFNFKFGILPVILSKLKKNKSFKILLAPRGEFSEGAFKLGNFKKIIFVLFAKLFRLYDDIFWHASSNYEADDIKNILTNSIDENKILIAPDLTNFTFDDSNFYCNNELQMNPFKICFISRISPKKNLLFALSVLSQVEEDVSFDIYGPIEDHKYWEKCMKLIDKIPSNIQIAYKGIIEHDKINFTFSKYNLFFFPTLGENFGHVIIESLCAGTPVLISNNTPWRNLKSSGVGWDLDLNDVVGYINAIQSIINMNINDYLLLRENVKKFGLTNVNDLSIIDANLKMFQLLLNEN